MAADRVHIARSGQEIGQFTVQEIPSLITSGQLMETDFFWRPGMTAWKPVYELVNTQKVWKLPFPRPEEKSANLWDQLLSRESKQTMLAMLWDKLTAAQQECQLTVADIEQINQATQSNLYRRCAKELEEWYLLMVQAYLEDHLFTPQEKINLNNLMYSLGLKQERAYEIQKDVFLEYYKKAFQAILNGPGEFTEKRENIRTLAQSIPLPSTVMDPLNTIIWGEILMQEIKFLGETFDGELIISPEGVKQYNQVAIDLDLHLANYPAVQTAFNRAQKYYKLLKGELTPIECDLQLGSETCYWMQPVNLLQVKRTVVRRNYGGFSSSIKIFGSLRYRVGSYDVQRETKDQLTKIDSGTAIFTDERVIFNGEYKNLNFKLNKILDIKEYNNGIEIGKDSGGDVFFNFDHGAGDATVLLKRLVREAKN
jgi:hypothetical protein